MLSFIFVIVHDLFELMRISIAFIFSAYICIVVQEEESWDHIVGKPVLITLVPPPSPQVHGSIIPKRVVCNKLYI